MDGEEGPEEEEEEAESGQRSGSGLRLPMVRAAGNGQRHGQGLGQGQSLVASGRSELAEQRGIMGTPQGCPSFSFVKSGPTVASSPWTLTSPFPGLLGALNPAPLTCQQERRPHICPADHW